MEIETMARYQMDVLVYVMNNGGVYHGDSDDAATWTEMQSRTGRGETTGGLRSTSLGWEVGYEKIAEACGGKGWCVRTEEELAHATREGWNAGVVGVINVIIEAGKGTELSFGWQAVGDAGKKKARL
jgi:2-hydroxyacyl-CoA lyase 1